MTQTEKINLNRLVISTLIITICHSLTIGQTFNENIYEKLCSSDSVIRFNENCPDSLLKIKNFFDKSCWKPQNQSRLDTVQILCLYISDDNLHNIYDNANLIKKTNEIYSYPDTGGAGSIILYENNYGICYHRAFSEMLFIPIKIIDINNIILTIDNKSIEYKRLKIK